MTSPPERIVLIRSGRHVGVALAALRTAYRGCQVTIVTTPAAEALLRQAGVPQSELLIYWTRPQFDAWPFLRSWIPLRLWLRGYDRVAVLWQDPSGADRANVDRAALLLSPRGFDAITPDGTLIRRETASLVTRELRTALRSMAALAVMALGLYLPAHLARLFRRAPRGVATRSR